MFSRILIANRGEIALRIIRACRELGVETVVVFSEADREARYLRYADQSICIGPPPPVDSYLNVSRIISAAEVADVEAIHPGYGFLAENSHFAEVCESCNIKFIGPPAQVMEKLGNKSVARRLAKEKRIPVVPGSDDVLNSEEEALETAHKVGYPVLIKAAGGGGGRGMRVAHNDVSLLNAYHLAKQEAEAAFKNGEVYLEKCIPKARHVEVQILADEHGHVIHLGERDCTLQRRHQKLVEEAPSPAVSSEVRSQMGRAAVKLARGVGYTNAGTVEFLLGKKKRFYFIEVNTRIQVEHPVTEMVTGVDLVKQQLLIAAGEELGLSQKRIRPRGTAIECRINAEDPTDDFKPCAGTIDSFVPPGGPGVRFDSHVYGGYRVSPYYDALLAKLIVHRPTRGEAITCMRNALQELAVTGVKTTVPLYLEIFSNKSFINGHYNTDFIDNLGYGK